MKQRPSIIAIFFATGFGSGFWPWGPGTAGALLATLMWWALGAWVDFVTLQAVTLAAIVLSTAIGTWSTNQVSKCWGEDPSRVVIDEMAGVWVALLAAEYDWRQAVAAFVLFRFFDILKPLGIRALDRREGGFWVMADDLLAGLYSLILIALVRWLM